MAKTLASFAPSPVFEGVADITVAGKGTQPLKLKFKFHNAKAMKILGRTIDGQQEEFKLEPGQEASDEYTEKMQSAHADVLLAVTAGWEFSDEFSKENLLTFMGSHPLSYLEIINAFFKAHTDAKVKN